MKNFMVVCPVIRINGDTGWEIFNGAQGKTVAPENAHTVLSMIVKACKGGEIYFSNLTLFKDDVFQMLHGVGIHFFEDKKNLKDLKEDEGYYLIGGDVATVFSITFKHNGQRITIIDPDNLLPGREKVLKTWGRHEAQATAKAMYRALVNLFEITGATKSPLITISGASKKVMRDNTKIDLIDANCTTLPNGQTLEEYVRPSYHGGLCLKNPDLEKRHIEEKGIVLDVNSLYPYVMSTMPLPIGTPRYFEGTPDEGHIELCKRGMAYFFAKVKVAFELKKDGVPCVRAYGADLLLYGQEWLTSSGVLDMATGKRKSLKDKKGKYKLMDLTLSYTDLLQLNANYHIYKIVYESYVLFSTTTALFTQTIDYLKGYKQGADGGQRQMSKTLMNALSGNMARLGNYKNYTVSFEGDKPVYGIKKTHGGTSSFVYIGSAITSYARLYLISYIKQVRDRWLYSDTDSIHLVGVDIPEIFEIDNEKLGAWKVEKSFDEIFYYKTKMYGYKKDGCYSLTLTGIPRDATKALTEKLDSGEISETLESLEFYPIDITRKSGYNYTYIYEQDSQTISDTEEYK